jgi:hypothetical protein
MKMQISQVKPALTIKEGQIAKAIESIDSVPFDGELLHQA